MSSALTEELRRPASKTVPGPKGSFLFGSIPEFRRDAVGMMVRSVRDYGDVVKIDLVKTAFLINHPDGVKHVLQDNHVNYKKNFIYDRLKPLIGNGLLTSNGETWKRQRRMAQPAFHKQRIAGFADLMVKHTGAMLQRWDVLAQRDEPFDVHAEMMKLTLVVVADALFSVNVMDDAAQVGTALTTALDVINDRFQSLLIIPQAIPTPQNRRFEKAMAVLDGLVNGIIESRRKSGDAGNDLLGMLMAARDDENGTSMSDEALRDEVMTMVLAGHETTANAMSWAFWLLSLHPAVERKLHGEVVGALGTRDPALADLPALKYSSMVMDEAMRLYPPIWTVAREAIEADEIGGYFIPRGSNIILCPYTTHRHPDFWDNPDGFDPARFSPERASSLHRGAFIPFAAGPRQCIGNNFANMEMAVILSMVSQRFQLHLEPNQEVIPDPMVTLRPRDGIRVRLQKQVSSA